MSEPSTKPTKSNSPASAALRAEVVRLLEVGASLVLLGADVEEPHAGPRDAEALARVARAHERVGQEVGGVGAHVRAHVEHDVEAVGIARGPEDGDGGAGHARRAAQAQHGHRHERAGVAAGDDAPAAPPRAASTADHMDVPWPWRMT
jgi:hypothetical protein